MPKPSRTWIFDRRPFTQQATFKAAIFTAAFSLVGAIVTGWIQVPIQVLLPSVIIYVLILFNTFFSIRLFASITPHDDPAQNIIDVLLGVLYLWMILTLGRSIWFLFACTVMFGIATLKYVFLLGQIPHSRLLRHKIIVDAVGTAGAAIGLLGAVLIDPELFLWVFAGGFALAQLDVFIRRPLYTVHD